MSVPDSQEVVEILKGCETDSSAEHAYRPDALTASTDERHIKQIASNGQRVVVVSDLHLGSGLDANLRYSGTENFFSDEAFSRFVDHLIDRRDENGCVLIINGDVVDFIRIVTTPETHADYVLWSERLAGIGVLKTPEELEQSIIPRERTFGLRTTAIKSAWKLWRSIDGHPIFFDALARWLAMDGNRLIITKGNHDLEWVWKEVRDGLRRDLAHRLERMSGAKLNDESNDPATSRLARISGSGLAGLLENVVIPNVYFVDDAIEIDETVYIEHGHRYDKFTNVKGSATGDYSKGEGERELNIPFGSFFNRYLINRIEYAYPYIDNIRPQEAIMPMLIRERFPLALKLLFKHLPMAIQMIGKPYWWYMFRRTIWFALAVVLPLIPVVWFLVSMATDIFSSSGYGGLPGGFIGEQIISLAGTVGGLIASYGLSRLVAWLELKEPSTLNSFGKDLLESGDYAVVSFGHTHTPDQFQVEGRWFFNTGTWTPKVETTSSAIRRDRMFGVLKIGWDEDGAAMPEPIERWDDSGGRFDQWPIVHSR